MSEALQPVLLVGVIIFVVMLCFIVHLNDLMKDARKDMARLLAERETLRLQFSQFYQLLAAGWTIDQQRTFANALETRWYLKAPAAEEVGAALRDGTAQLFHSAARCRPAGRLRE